MQSFVEWYARCGMSESYAYILGGSAVVSVGALWELGKWVSEIAFVLFWPSAWAVPDGCLKLHLCCSGPVLGAVQGVQGTPQNSVLRGPGGPFREAPRVFGRAPKPSQNDFSFKFPFVFL